MAIEVLIDREQCIGSGVCCSAVPAVFKLDEDEIAMVIDPNADTEANIVYAAKGCPTLAITVFKDGAKIA